MCEWGQRREAAAKYRNFLYPTGKNVEAYIYTLVPVNDPRKSCDFPRAVIWMQPESPGQSYSSQLFGRL